MQKLTKTIKIVAELQKPLSLTVADFTLKNKVKYTIETVQKGKEYRIRFTSIPGIKENFRGILKLKTNYSEKPEISLVIHGRFKSSGRPPSVKSSGIGKGVTARKAKCR